MWCALFIFTSLFGGSVTLYLVITVKNCVEYFSMNVCYFCFQVEIESGRLLFRHDLSPVADVGLRQDLLDMLLLNYSHVWLRIGLEVHVHV